MNDLVNSDLEQINRQIKELLGLYRTFAGSAAISENEFWIWYTLMTSSESYSQQEVCELCSMPKQTANTIINHMAQKGYVSLETVPGSRNRKHIHVLGLGRIYGDRIITPVHQAERRAMSSIAQEDRQNCIATLDQYIHSLRGEFHGTSD